MTRSLLGVSIPREKAKEKERMEAKDEAKERKEVKDAATAVEAPGSFALSEPP